MLNVIRKEEIKMKRSILFLAFLILAAAIGIPRAACPQGQQPVLVQITPSEVKWMPFKAAGAGAQIAFIYGNPSKPELYVMLVKYPPNMKFLPHFHPVEQVATVLSGTIYFGLGKNFDPNKLKMFPVGSVYTEPLRTSHFSATKEEEAILQVTGIGPIDTQYVNPADDPRKK
jgi:quercetin dioxygenase-like cupin family protein